MQHTAHYKTKLYRGTFRKERSVSSLPDQHDISHYLYCHPINTMLPLLTLQFQFLRVEKNALRNMEQHFISRTKTILC